MNPRRRTAELLEAHRPNDPLGRFIDVFIIVLILANVGAIVLECTNMAPYADDIRRATGLPVFSILTLINWFQASLSPGRLIPAPHAAMT